MSKRTERIVILLTPAELEEVDRFAESMPLRVNRSEVIRELLRRGLDAVDGKMVEPSASRPDAPEVATAQDPQGITERLDRLEIGLASVIRSEGERVIRSLSVERRPAAMRPAPAPVRPAPPNPVEVPEDTPALDPVAEAEGLRKLAAFVERNRLPPPPPEPSIEELQAKAMALQAQRQKRPDFKPLPANVVPAPGQGDTEPYVHLFPEEPRAPEERTSPYWDDDEE